MSKNEKFKQAAKKYARMFSFKELTERDFIDREDGGIDVEVPMGKVFTKPIMYNGIDTIWIKVRKSSKDYMKVSFEDFVSAMA